MSQNTPASKYARVSRPVRQQVEMQLMSLDQMLPHDHQARLVWQYVEQLDLEPLYEGIRVSANQAGRSAIDPRILVALWMLATLEGVGSARELARRCERDIAYMWICGGVSVNYHTLSDARNCGDFLQKLLVDSIASLVDRQLVPLETIAQDGMRVRANAGKSSFRGRPSLETLQQQAQQHLDRLQAENQEESQREQADARRRSAQERAARERAERIAEALQQQQQLAAQREKRKKGDGQATRVSTTDPQARTMKMANGGFDPAYNVQFATDGDVRMIVAVEVINQGTDGGQLDPMLSQIQENYGKVPSQVLADSAYAKQEDVSKWEARGAKIVSSVPRQEEIQKAGKDPYAPGPKDTPQYAAFRARMAQPHYQELYKQRPSIAEFPNADCRNRNLRQFPVRGLAKVKAVALWHALAFNFRRMRNLGILEA